MKKKRTAQSGSFSLQLVLCSAAVCSMITGTLLAFFHPEAPAKASHPAAAGLTFAERVAYQRAIEEVYWHHRIWPKRTSRSKAIARCSDVSRAGGKRLTSICVPRKSWRTAGKDRSVLNNCKPKWIAWRSRASSHRFYAKSFTRLAMIPRLSLSVWRDPC